ncbi:hypothetical protein AVEN_205759-1 [Araneus ventricosus]|uniref:Uncharacterized protein n=1 Tax=Araneus ventricosus TaxID=182803 RepID=A0A4Y1ZRX5_ARAVE|nr:hypothetical protein AVEN_249715-1 [Araneus ventricosus]GBL63024.1 hypothetical protein AVEN_50381-1 [Araneus ventricosus]GBL63030.1 hypothetical protein AVEN_69202-1 [Araneus ventricosus]GBL63053.1 hypothetical protein AVEN_205759-1 [Araneus ventricosus]
MGKDNWTPYHHYLRSDFRISPQKKPTAPDRLSSMLRRNFETASDSLARYERVNPGLLGVTDDLVVMFRLRGGRIPSSKSDSTEDPPCIWAFCTLNHM